MATTATIDNILLTTAKTSENSSKSSSGNSGDFEKIFKTANETYNTSTPSHSTTTNTVKNDSKKQDDSKSKVDSDKTANNDNKVEDNQTKTEENKEPVSNNDDTKAGTKTDTKADNSEQEKPINSEQTNAETKESTEVVKTKIEENTAEKNQPAQSVDPKQIKPDNSKDATSEIATQAKVITDTEQVTDTKEIKTNIPKNKPKEEKEETKTTDTKDTTDNNQVQTPVVDNSIQTSSQAAIIGSNIETSPANNKKNTDDKTTAITNSTETTSNKQQTQYVQTDIDIDVSQVTSKITSNSNIITTDQSNDQTNNIKIQPQTQQVISNLKASQDDAAQIQPEEQTTQSNNTPQQTGIQTEIIKTNAEVIVSDANIKPKETNTKQDLKEVTNQNTLTQDMLDKTNAKVVSTESSNSETANHFSSKQNAQEHVIKLSLENNNENTNNAELDNISDKTIQSNFDKTLSGAQTIIQTAPTQTTQTSAIETTAQTTLQHMPKELSQTDILSQINNQLNVKNLQGGTSKVNIVLQPENLGKINLELVNSKEGLTAHMTTDNEQVKEILTKSLDSLKNSLGNQGVNVQSVTIKVDATQKQSNDNMSSFDDNSQPNTGNQDFSNNSQRQNQNEFVFDENTGSFSYKAETQTAKEPDSLADTEVENLVSIGSRSTRVDYKV